jgi:hypothetical protein
MIKSRLRDSFSRMELMVFTQNKAFAHSGKTKYSVVSICELPFEYHSAS